MNKITGEHQIVPEETLTKRQVFIQFMFTSYLNDPMFPKLVPMTCTLPFHTAVLRKVVQQKHINVRDNVKNYYG